MTVTINGTTGITSPEVVLDNAAADGGQVVLKSSGYSDWNWDNYSGRLRAYYSATEYFTITNSGNVGIGLSSPTGKLDVAGSSSRVRWNLSNAYAYQVVTNPADSAYATNRVDAASHDWYVSNSFKMTLDTSGNLLVGQTTSGGANSNSFSFSPSSKYATFNHASGTGSGTGYISFAYNGGEIGSITQNGTTGVLYNLTSDYRLKNNPTALTGAKEFVMALQPKTWDWWDGSGKGVGFIAHEFMEVAKYSGNGEKDAVDADGKPVYQSIQPSSSEVMANLVAFIQEQQTIITTLTARIEALEAKNA